jgi:hypothetical protein
MKKVLTMILNLHEEDISKPDKYEIVHVYRYEGDSNPDEAMVLALNPDQAKRCLCNWALQIQFHAQALIQIH